MEEYIRKYKSNSFSKGLNLKIDTKVGKKKRQNTKPSPNRQDQVNYLVNKIVDLEMQLETVKKGRPYASPCTQWIQKTIILVIALIGCCILVELGHQLLFRNTYMPYYRYSYEPYSQSAPKPAPSKEGSDPSMSFVLLSTFRPVTADVMGALGPPQVVTEESTTSWLSDRWQVPLTEFHEDVGVNAEPHWLEIDLQRSCLVRKVVIDWENAYSDSWVVEGRLTGSSDWVRLVDSRLSKEVERRPYHVIQEAVTFTGHDPAAAVEPASNMHPHAVRYVRLTVSKASTKWGISIWRLQVWGLEINLSR